jgi:hypothetical protein
MPTGGEGYLVLIGEVFCRFLSLMSYPILTGMGDKGASNALASLDEG